MTSIAVEQTVDSLLAVPAFLPATICTGYLAAWFTNLHDFRNRSLVDRLFWSVPLSVAVSTISSVLIGKAFSLTAVVMFFWERRSFSCRCWFGTFPAQPVWKEVGRRLEPVVWEGNHPVCPLDWVGGTVFDRLSERSPAFHESDDF